MSVLHFLVPFKDNEVGLLKWWKNHAGCERHHTGVDGRFLAEKPYPGEALKVSYKQYFNNNLLATWVRRGCSRMALEARVQPFYADNC